MESNRRNTFFVGAIMFMMGGCGLAYEYTFSKLSSDLLGNTVRQWAIIIAIMLFAMGIGADWQKKMTDRFLVDKLLGSQILLALLGSFSPILLLFAYTAVPYHFFLLLYGVSFFIGVLIGFEIPLLTRINEGNSGEIRVNLAHILKMDYIGALCGALLWVFVLTLIFRFAQVGFAVGILTLLTAAVTVAAFWKQVKIPWVWTSVIVVSLGSMIWGFSESDRWTLDSEQRMYQDKVVFSESTPYQHIVLTKSRTGDYRCFINGNLQFNSADEYIYHENLVHPAMLMAPRHERVLVLGGGDGLAVREILKYPDVREIVLVDIDPQMTTLAVENPFLSELNEGSLQSSKLKVVENNALIPSGETDLYVTPRTIRKRDMPVPVTNLHVLNLDAAKYVEQASGTFDVIIVDFPDPSSPDLAKLYSKLFYTHLRGKLNADGIFAIQSTSPIHAKETFLCIGRTLHAAGLSAIPYHDNVPSFGEWGWWIGGNDYLYSDEKLKSRVESLPEIEVSTRYLDLPLLRSNFVFGKQILDSPNTDINSLTNPAIYRYYLNAWKETF